jgi:hypothetical protein
MMLAQLSQCEVDARVSVDWGLRALRMKKSTFANCGPIDLGAVERISLHQIQGVIQILGGWLRNRWGGGYVLCPDPRRSNEERSAKRSAEDVHRSSVMSERF